MICNVAKLDQMDKFIYLRPISKSIWIIIIFTTTSDVRSSFSRGLLWKDEKASNI